MRDFGHQQGELEIKKKVVCVFLCVFVCVCGGGGAGEVVKK